MKIVLYQEFSYPKGSPIGTTSDNLFQIAKDNGFEGTQFKKIQDGAFFHPDGKPDMSAIDEYVYKAGTDLIKRSPETTKKDLIKEIKVDWTPTLQSGLTLGTKYLLNNERN